jgi:hypothetical protein
MNPNGIFHVSVFVHFYEAFLGIKPHWVLFRKFFRLKPQPSANDPRVVGGAGIQMREDATEQYLSYKLIDSNQDLEVEMVLHHQPPLGVAEAEREAAKASALMEHGADHAGGYSTTRAAAEDQGFERS